jgi:hypothetical protein
MKELIKLDVGARLAILDVTRMCLHERDGGKADVMVLLEQGLEEYLTEKLTQSISLKLRPNRLSAVDLFREVLTKAEHMPWTRMYTGYGDSKHGFEWAARIKNWSNDTLFLWYNKAEKIWYLSTKTTFLIELKQNPSISASVLPFFLNYINQLTITTKTLVNAKKSDQTFSTSLEGTWIATGQQINPKKEKTMFDKLKDQNIEAAKLAGKLTVGKTANGILADALLARLPWYSRLFAGTALKDTSIAKLATANLAVVLAEHFGKGNENLAFVTEAMLQDAMVEVIRDGDAVKSILAQLSSLAGTLQNETK